MRALEVLAAIGVASGIAVSAASCGGTPTQPVKVPPSNNIPRITVIYPNGGEALESGSSYEIRWDSNVSDRVYVKLVDSRSASRDLIQGPTPNDGIERITLPREAVGDHKIEVSATALDGLIISDQSDNYFRISPPPPAEIPMTVTLLAGGDAFDPKSPEYAIKTFALLDRFEGLVALLGDIVYDSMSHEETRQFHDTLVKTPQKKARFRPVPGNHEYQTQDARGYFDYFREIINDQPFYDFSYGNWHIYAINSNIPIKKGSIQYELVKNELINNKINNKEICQIVMMHHSFFSSGPNRHDPREQRLYQDIRDIIELFYDFGIDIMLSGHDHNLQIRAKQKPDGTPDPQRGIQALVAGTLGHPRLYGFPVPQRNTLFEAQAYGWLILTLMPDRYSYLFEPIQGYESARYSGSGTCYSPGGNSLNFNNFDMLPSTQQIINQEFRKQVLIDRFKTQGKPLPF